MKRETGVMGLGPMLRLLGAFLLICALVIVFILWAVFVVTNYLLQVITESLVTVLLISS